MSSPAENYRSYEDLAKPRLKGRLQDSRAFDREFVDRSDSTEGGAAIEAFLRACGAVESVGWTTLTETRAAGVP